MRKLMVAIAGAVALTCSAFAGTWFNGGIAEGWPTAGTGLTGGTWTSLGASEYDATAKAVIIDADDDTGPLTFTATTAKSMTTSSEIEISATVTFTPFETLPAVPADAKAGVIIADSKYYGIGKVDDAAAWVELGAATDTDTAKVITVTRNANGLVYAVDGTAFTAVTPVSTDAFQNVKMTGDGELAALSATTTDYVEPTMVIIGQATYTKEGDTYTITPNAGYTIGSIMINGAAQAFTPGEGGVVTFTASKYTAAQDIVVATKKTVPGTLAEHPWYTGIGANCYTVLPYTGNGEGTWSGAMDDDMLAVSGGTGKKFAWSFLADDLATASATAKSELNYAAVTNVYTDLYTTGAGMTILRGVAMSKSLNVMLGLDDYNGASLFSAPINGAAVLSGDNKNTYRVSNDKGIPFETASFSSDAQYLYSINGATLPAELGGDAKRCAIVQWKVVDGLKGDGVKLTFVKKWSVGAAVRFVRCFKIGGKDIVYGMEANKVVAVDTTGDAVTELLTLPVSGNYGALYVSGITAGTPHMTVVMSPNGVKSVVATSLLNVYTLAADGLTATAEPLKSFLTAKLAAAEFGTPGAHCMDVFVSDDESTLYFGWSAWDDPTATSLKTLESRLYTAQYHAPQAITVTPDANATYTLTVNGAAATSGDTFEAGATYTVVATPKEDYKYTEAPAGWTLTEGSLTQSGTLGLAAIAITIPAPVQDEIEFTVQPIANASYEVEGATAVEGKNDTYKALPDTDITVTYTADEGYLFSDGTTTLVAQGKATKGGTIVPSEAEVKKGAVKIGTTYYLTLKAAFDAATAGQTVTLVSDIAAAVTNENTASFTLDLNGKTVSSDAACATIKQDAIGSTLTIVDSVGTGKVVNSVDAYDMGQAIWARQGSIVVNAGYFENASTYEATVYVGAATARDCGSTVTINGGTFVNKQAYRWAPAGWGTLNVWNQFTDTSAIKVYGGTFSTDPAKGDDHLGGTFVADGYISEADGELYTVRALVPVTGVTLDKDAVELAPEAIETLTATVAPENADVKTTAWTSSDEAVATVAGGVVMAVAAGTATITVTVTDKSGNTKTATCTVTVKSAAEPSIPQEQGTVDVDEDGNVTVHPLNDTVTEIELSNVSEDATVIVPLSVGRVMGVESDQLVVTYTPTEAGSKTYYITEAFDFYGDATSGVTYELNPEGKVKDIDTTPIPVTPVVDSEVDTPVGVTDTQASVAIRTIPGLTYQLVRGDEPGVIETALETEGARKTATGPDTSLVDTDKPATKAFYKVQVTK